MIFTIFLVTRILHLMLFVSRKIGFVIDKFIEGGCVTGVLDYVQFNHKNLVRDMETWVSPSVKKVKITLQEGREFLAIYRSGLYGYTYLE